MPLVQFNPSGKKVIVEDSLTIAQAASRAGLTVALPCGGKGTCGRCLVSVEQGSVVRYSQPPAGAPLNAALACRTAVGTADCVLGLPEHELCSEDRLDEPAETPCTDLPLFDFPPGEVDGAPSVPSALLASIRLHVPPPPPDEVLSDLERVNREFRKSFPSPELEWGLPALASLPEALRSGSPALELLFFRKSDSSHIISAKPADAGAIAAGVAVDLGTTTVSVKIYDIQTGKELAAATGYNEQIHCGEDIISRIDYARTEAKLMELKEKVLITINRLIELAAKSIGLPPSSIHCAVISGNTVMTHFLLGITAEYLRRAPYTPVLLQAPLLNAAALGIAGSAINPAAVLYLSPAAGSYVGGDITAGLLCTDMASAEAIALFIDIGTNGEIVLGNRDFLMACACSAGPAFEGGGIGCGMRALPGAVNKVSINPQDVTPKLGVIGGGKPRGICGSGMLDLISELFLLGALDPAGRFCREVVGDALEYEGNKARYRLVAAADSYSGKPIYITELDIENIMRAKAAVFSACSLLLANVGLEFSDVERVYVAGGFGQHLNITSAVNIGLLPDLPVTRFSYLGNTSLSGSARLLLSQESRELQAKTTQRLTYINLINEHGYSAQYTAALFLPHTDSRLFPTVQKQIKY